MAKLFRVSKTQIKMYVEDCGMRWYFRYALGIKTRPAGALPLGGAYHDTAARNYKQKAKTQTDLNVKEQTDFFEQTLKTKLEAEEIDYAEGENKDTLKAQGIGLVKAFHRDIAPSIAPISADAVEENIRLLVFKQPTKDRADIYNLDSDYRTAGNQAHEVLEQHEHEWAYLLDGTLDITDSNEIIRENKTASKTPSADNAHKLIDLTQYAMMYRAAKKKVEKGVAVDTAIKAASPKGLPQESTRTREQIRAHLNLIGTMAKAISQDIFLPHTDWYGCSERFCGWWSRCPYGGLHRKTVDMGENLTEQLEASLK